MASGNDEEAALLARLQAQFGDIDMSEVLNHGGAPSSAGGEGDDESSSAAAEPTPAELAAWQEAQFARGRLRLETDQIGKQSAGEVHRAALKKRRLRRKGAAEEDWELLDGGSFPQLDAESRFFPASESGDGVHPLLAELAASDPDALRSEWTRLYSSGGGDGLSLATLREKVRGYDGPTVLLIEGRPSASGSVGLGSEARSTFRLGFFTTTTWTESAEMFGTDDDCFLFSLGDEKGVTIVRPRTRPNGRAMRPCMYCRPPSFRSGADGGAVVGLGVGGSPSCLRLHVTETMEGCRCLPHDPAFGDGDLMSGLGEGSLYRFDAEAVEVWGVGGREWIEHALNEREKARETRDAGLERARTVDKRAFLDDLRAGDKEGGLFAHGGVVAERDDCCV